MAGTTTFGESDRNVDGILRGTKWDVQPDQTLTWSVSESSFFSWAGRSDEFAQVSNIFNSIDSIIDVDFQYIGWYADEVTPADITITFDYFSLYGSSAYGVASFPGDGTYEGNVYMNIEAGMLQTLSPGQIGYHVLIHEIGHALGLSHPHDDGGNGWPTFAELGISASNNLYTTVMSYEPPFETEWGYGWATTPMMWDVFALQELYGAENDTGSGDNHYYLVDNFQANVLWDSGGNDTIDASQSSFENWIDLREGRFNFGSSQDVTGIAYGTTIEDAVGSPQNDTMIGNGVANSLVGQNGDDVIAGRDGSDVLFGESGNDILYGNKNTDLLVGGSGNDTLFGGQNDGNPSGAPLAQRDGVDTVSGGSGDDLLYGNHGSDLLDGGEGADRLFGGQDSDTLSGGAGDDVLYGNLGHDAFSFGNANEGSDQIFGYTTAEDTFALATGVSFASVVVIGTDTIVTLSTGTVVELIGVIDFHPDAAPLV